MLLAADLADCDSAPPLGNKSTHSFNKRIYPYYIPIIIIEWCTTLIL